MTDRLEDELSRSVAPLEPPPALARRVREEIGSKAGPVRPLAPPAVRALGVVVPGLAIALAFSVWRDLLDPMPAGRVVAFVATALSTGLGAWLAMRSAVPGAAPSGPVSGAFLLLPAFFGGLAVGFCSGAGPLGPSACLWLGLAVAIAPALAALWLLARGFPLSPVKGGALAGLTAGLFGLCMLHLTCPLASAAHLLVMHGGVLVAALSIGAALGAVTRGG